MAIAFDPTSLPVGLRGSIERALRERDGHDEVIEEIKHHLASGGARTPDLLVALATLTYDDAATVVLHRLGEASEQALRLLDEAAEARGSGEGLESLRSAFEASRDRERDRDVRLRMLLLAPERASATGLAALAQQFLLRGDDRVGRALMEEAARLDTEDEAVLSGDTAQAG